MNTAFFKTGASYAMVLVYLLFVGYTCHARTFKDLRVRNCLQAGSLNVCRNAIIGGNLTVKGTINGPNGPFFSFDVDDGANVVPVGGVVQVSGISGAGFVPSGIETHNGGTNDIFIEDRRWVTQYVVDSSAQVGARGTFQTIQGAMDAAAAAGANVFILVRPGTYTEDLTFRGNIHLAGACTDGRVSLVTVVGNHTYAEAGACVIEDMAFNAAAGDLFTINPAAGAQSLFIQKYCGHNAGGRLAVINPTGGAFAVYAEVMCQSQADTQAIVAAGNSFTLLDGSTLGNNTTTSLITVDDFAQVSVSTGSLNSQGDVFGILSATANVQIQNSTVTSPAGAFVRFSALGGVIAAHVTVNTTDPSGNNVIGAGVYQYADIVSVVSNGIDQFTIQQPADWKPYATDGTDAPGGAVRGTAAFNDTQFSVTDGFVNLFSPFFSYTPVASPGATYTVLTTDSYLSVDTSAVGVTTINLPITPVVTAGRTFTIKDRTGNAGTAGQEIVVQANGGAVNIDGAPSQIINTNFGFIQVLYNGSTYEIY